METTCTCHTNGEPPPGFCISADIPGSLTDSDHSEEKSKRLSKEEILSALNIEQFYRDELTRHNPAVRIKIRPNGWSENIPCPFHSEKEGSFGFNVNGQYKCWGCDAKGNAINFYMQIHGTDFRTALSALAERAGLSLCLWKISPVSGNGFRPDYLRRKQLEAYNLYYVETGNVKIPSGTLAVPIYDAAFTRVSWQWIKPDSEKRLKSGAKPAEKLLFGIVPKPTALRGTDTLCFTEGWSDAAAVFQSCGHPVIITFGKGNIGRVVSAFRNLLPDVRLIICADNDELTRGGKGGLSSAAESAKQHGCLVAYSEDYKDMNDVLISKGADAVRELVDRAVRPEEIPAGEYRSEPEPKKHTELPKLPEKPAEHPELPSQQILDALYANEDGDSELFIHLHRGKLIFDHSEGQWYVWQGHYWKQDSKDHTYACVSDVAALYAGEAERQTTLRIGAELEGSRETAGKHAAHCEALIKRIGILRYVKRKKNVLYGAARLLKVNPMAMEGTEWDSKPFILPCINGMVDLKTGDLKNGTPTDFIRTHIPHEYKADAECPNWIKFLYEIFDNNAEMVEFIQRLFGYAVAGRVRHHIFPVFYGEGRNGKGTLLETLKYVMGNFAHKTNAETLMEQRRGHQRGQPDADTHALWGKRLVYASETSEGSQFNMGKVKELVGGDTLNARLPFSKRPTEFTPAYLLILMTNSKPRVRGSDFAFWERLLLVPFTLSYVDREPEKENERRADIHLNEKLRAEASGILNWLIEGCLGWQKEGLNPPESVRAATKEYRKEEDTVGTFLDECCEEDPQAEVKAGDIFKAYQTWASERNEKPMNQTRFGKEMKNRFDSYKGKKGYFYLGIKLAKD